MERGEGKMEKGGDKMERGEGKMEKGGDKRGEVVRWRGEGGRRGEGTRISDEVDIPHSKGLPEVVDQV